MLTSVQMGTQDEYTPTTDEKVAAAHAEQAVDANVQKLTLGNLPTGNPKATADAIMQLPTFLSGEKDGVVSIPNDTRAMTLIMGKKSSVYWARKIKSANMLIYLSHHLYAQNELMGNDLIPQIQNECINNFKRKLGKTCKAAVKIQPDIRLNNDGDAIVLTGPGVHLSDAPLTHRLELEFKTVSGTSPAIEPRWAADPDQDMGSPFGVRDGQSVLIIGGIDSEKAVLRMEQFPWDCAHLLINVSRPGRPIMVGDGKELSAQPVRLQSDENGVFSGMVTRRRDPRRPSTDQQPEGVLVRLIPVTSGGAGHHTRRPQVETINKAWGLSGLFKAVFGWFGVGSSNKAVRQYHMHSVVQPNVHEAIRRTGSHGNLQPPLVNGGAIAPAPSGSLKVPSRTPIFTQTPTSLGTTTTDSFCEPVSSPQSLPVRSEKNLRITNLLIPYIAGKIGGPEGCCIDMAPLTGEKTAPLVGVLADSHCVRARDETGNWAPLELPATYGGWTIERPPPALAQDYVAMLQPPADWESAADQMLNPDVPVLFGRHFDGSPPRMFAAGMLTAPTAILWLSHGQAHLDTWRHSRRHLVLEVHTPGDLLNVSLATDESKPAVLLDEAFNLITALQHSNRAGRIKRGQHIVAGVYLMRFN